MDRATWNDDRALIFAQGLYHVAACDGLDPREAQALKIFLEKVGLPPDLDLLDRTPFDYAEASKRLHSSWLRRAFIKACRLMVQMDGQVSPQERDIMRSISAALGVGEAFALEGIEDGPAAPDALVEWIQNLAIDFVSWDDETQNVCFWPFPHPRHPLSEGGQLKVAPGQALVVRADGVTVDTLTPGEYIISPQALPGLATARDWSTGPVAAELMYVKTGPSPIMRWGTTEAVVLDTASRGAVQLRAFGRFSIRFHDAEFVVDRFCRASVPVDADVHTRLRRIVSGRFAQVLRGLAFQDDAHLLTTLNDLDALRELLLPSLKAHLEGAGLKLYRFMIENLTAPMELGLNPTSKRAQSMRRVGDTLLGKTGSLGGSLGGGSLGSSVTALFACSKCYTPCPAGSAFCSHCGTPQRRNCGKCGSSLPARARFCSDCGAGQS